MDRSISVSSDMPPASGFLRSSVEGGPRWFAPIREKARDAFLSMGFPTRKWESWRYTRVDRILDTPFEPVGPTVLPRRAEEEIGLSGVGGTRLVFVGGRYDPELSIKTALPAGAWVGSLARAMDERRECLGPLGRHASWEGAPFVALNTAEFSDGALVWIPDGVSLTAPVHLVFSEPATIDSTIAHPRVLVVMGRISELVLIESHLGHEPRGSHFANGVAEIILGENARLSHIRREESGAESIHVATTQVVQAAGSRYESTALSMRGALSRHDLKVRFDDPGASCILRGLTMTNGRRHADIHVEVDHAAPDCTSDQLFKSVLSDESTFVFNGRVVVRPGANQTRAEQKSANLLKSTDARVNAKPELEIYADDVRCAHGATVGELDRDALFYLRSRGIGGIEAREILTFAFAGEVIGAIEPVEVKEELGARYFPGILGNEDLEILR